MSILIDNYQRKHNYLRISLTDRCNLRCTYCMPEEGIKLAPRSQMMNADEVYEMAKIFVNQGVNKIRLTGGEPLVRKDFELILRKLASLNVELSITSNAVLIHNYISLFKEVGLNKVNLSLDTLNRGKFKDITRRDDFEIVMQNIDLLEQEGFEVKINNVLINDFNEDEIIDFIELTKDKNIEVRFIEFMPFDGNNWDKSKMISLEQILEKATLHYGDKGYNKVKDALHDTAKHYKVNNYKGVFAVISSVSNPFCDTCNRLRLTANGNLKNCLFSAEESDLLTAMRKGIDIQPIIEKVCKSKFKIRGGMDTNEKFENPEFYSKNRTMTAIGG